MAEVKNRIFYLNWDHAHTEAVDLFMSSTLGSRIPNQVKKSLYREIGYSHITSLDGIFASLNSDEEPKTDRCMCAGDVIELSHKDGSKTYHAVLGLGFKEIQFI